MGEFEEGDGLEGWLEEDVGPFVASTVSLLMGYIAFGELGCGGGVDACDVRAEFRQAGVRGWGASCIATCIPGSFPHLLIRRTGLIALQYIPSMMASYDWRVRHAGLMAVAAIAEGTAKVDIAVSSLVFLT
jgi:hypothetical protein